MSAVSELWASVLDWRQNGDAKGHAVALWRVLTGRVEPSDRYGLAGDCLRDPVASELDSMSLDALAAFAGLLRFFGWAWGDSTRLADLQNMRRVIQCEMNRRKQDGHS